MMDVEANSGSLNFKKLKNLMFLYYFVQIILMMRGMISQIILQELQHVEVN